jgi:branched-chain amino acid transport system ATP-binding protein
MSENINSEHVEHVLSVKGLTKHYGGIHALDACTLEIAPNQITAIIGPNGSGKTTLFDAITRIIPVDSGEIILNKKHITKAADYNVAKSGISRTFQQVRLFKNLTVKEHLEIALNIDDESLFKSVLSKLFRKDIKKNVHNTKLIEETLALVGFDKPLHTYASNLSYGQRKLLDLAIAIIKPHQILLLDEPVAGVNPKLRQDIVHIINTLKERGETIVIIEHDMNFVMALADTVFVMEAGKIIAKGKPQEIQDNKRVLEAYLGG